MRSREKNNSELQETKTGEWRVLKRSCTCPTNCGSESLRFCLRCGQEIRIVIKETFASPQKKQPTAKNLFRLPDFRLSVCTKVATVPVCNRSGYYTSNNFFFLKSLRGIQNHKSRTLCVCYKFAVNKSTVPLFIMAGSSYLQPQAWAFNSDQFHPNKVLQLALV